MAINDKLNRIKEIKEDIKQALIDKGVEVTDEDSFGSYADKINEISVSDEPVYMNPDFFQLRTNNNTNYKGLMAYCSAQIDISNWDTSNVTDMSRMFYYCNSLKTLDLSSLDTSNVTDMGYMFYYCQKLRTLDLSSLVTSNVTDMIYMFYNCETLGTLDVSSWDTSNVTDMGYMFHSCKTLGTLDVSSWDTSNVTSMTAMFYNCSNLEHIIGELDISNLKNGLSYLYNVFSSCSKLTTLRLVNIYKNSKMTNSNYWSINLGQTKVSDECLIGIISELPDLINDKGLTTTSNIKLTLPTSNTLTEEQVQPAIDKGWSVVNTTY